MQVYWNYRESLKSVLSREVHYSESHYKTFYCQLYAYKPVSGKSIESHLGFVTFLTRRLVECCHVHDPYLLVSCYFLSPRLLLLLVSKLGQRQSFMKLSSTHTIKQSSFHHSRVHMTMNTACIAHSYTHIHTYVCMHILYIRTH